MPIRCDGSKIRGLVTGDRKNERLMGARSGRQKTKEIAIV